MCPLFHIENTNNGGQWKDRGFIVYVFWLFFFFVIVFVGEAPRERTRVTHAVWQEKVFHFALCPPSSTCTTCPRPVFDSLHHWTACSPNILTGFRRNFARLTFSMSVLNHWSATWATLQKSLSGFFFIFLFFYFNAGTIFYPWGVLERLILAFQTSNLIPFFWPNVPLACSDCALPFYLNAYLWICHFSHLKGTGVFCFCFFFSGAILVVDPDQMTLSVITFLTSLCSELTLKHWFGEVRRHFWGFCPQKGTFYKC